MSFKETLFQGRDDFREVEGNLVETTCKREDSNVLKNSKNLIVNLV